MTPLNDLNGASKENTMNKKTKHTNCLFVIIAKPKKTVTFRVVGHQKLDMSRKSLLSFQMEGNHQNKPTKENGGSEV